MSRQSSLRSTYTYIDLSDCDLRFRSIKSADIWKGTFLFFYYHLVSFSLCLSLFGRKNNTFRTSSCNWHELFFLSLLSSSSSSLFLLLCSISYSFHSLFPRSSNRNHLSQNDENRGNLCSWIIDQPSKKKKSTVWTLLLRSWHIPHIVFFSFS